MRKITALIIAFIMIATLFTGCGTVKNEKFTILTTNFAIYDWTKNIVGDICDVVLLIDNGSDIHSYQPGVKAIAKIATCDLFVYVGGESESWVSEALENKSNKGRTELCLLDSEAFTSYTEELAEGMQGGEKNSEAAEIDEHIWLSLNVAKKCTWKIADVLSEKLPENAVTFAENADKYVKELDALDDNFRNKLTANGPIVLADRFPFRYFVEDYGIKYYAAFSGCSAETEASVETVAFLTNVVTENNITHVFVLKGNNQKLAETIAPNAEILVLDSIENTTTSDNTSYIELMSQNMETILRAF